MPKYVPGYGTFDPDLPEWLVVGKDGRLYNINAAENRLGLVVAWTPPEGYHGGGGVTFTPEGSPTPQPPEPPAPSVPVGPLAVNPALLSQLLAAMRATIAHDNEMLALAGQRMNDDMARITEGLRLSAKAADALDAVLADLQQQVNVQSK